MLRDIVCVPSDQRTHHAEQCQGRKEVDGAESEEQPVRHEPMHPQRRDRGEAHQREKGAPNARCSSAPLRLKMMSHVPIIAAGTMVATWMCTTNAHAPTAQATCANPPGYSVRSGSGGRQAGFKSELIRRSLRALIFVPSGTVNGHVSYALGNISIPKNKRGVCSDRFSDHARDRVLESVPIRNGQNLIRICNG